MEFLCSYERKVYRKNNMKNNLTFCGLFILFIITFRPSLQAQNDAPLYEFRGVWIASVANIDWPSRPGLDAETQKRELLWTLDQHQISGMNAIMLQIRPTADAFYDDGKEPWSYYLTGKQGEAPQPHYDPLAFAVEKAHERGMELHAWFNPYRASQDLDPNKRSENHISHTKPEWFFTYDGKTYFNPGIPEVREYIIDVILDVVKRYDIDGVHFDDYFYPYPGEDPLPDKDTYEKYGADRFESIEDWRRDNVDLLIKELNEAIHAEKPWVKFGISPFAIWRNKKEDDRGSETNGFSSYSGLYADVYKWGQEGWMDYVNPQIYCPFGYPPAPYENLLDWWDQHSFDRHVYVGMAAYRAMGTKDGWEDKSQLPRQIRALREKENIHGSVYFSSRSLMNHLAGLTDSLRADFYHHPALPPTMPWLDDVPPEPVTEINASVIENQYVRLRWEAPAAAADGDESYGYVIYRYPEGENVNGKEARHIIHISYRPDTFFFDILPQDEDAFIYEVRAIDRMKNISEKAQPIKISRR